MVTFSIFCEEKKLKAVLSHTYQTERKKNPQSFKRKRVIVLAGPTASGKTDLSLALAEAIGGEIVSADSMQVYKGMDIGTSKVSEKDRKKIPHHLIDIRDLEESFNAVIYFHEAQNACKEIFLRENVPIVVGGTGFYLHAFLYGPPGGPPSNPELRKQLENQMNALGTEELYERLQILDPEYANKITPFDKQKIIRGLEIIYTSQKKVSDFPKEKKSTEDDTDYRCWFVYYPKNILYPKIEKRCEKMIEEGFIEEVKRLEKMGLRENQSASQAIGYKQCLEYLRTSQTKRDFEDFMMKFKQATRKYAKRQFTWFRKEPLFRWVNLEQMNQEYIKETILQDFEIGL